jgi:hypothetical protein
MERAICHFRHMIYSVITVTVLFMVASVIPSTSIQFTNTKINDKIITTNLLLQLISNENSTISTIADHPNPDYLAYVMTIVKDFTNIQINDLTSYLQNELIGEKMGRESLPVSPFAYESTPPLEVLLYERELSTRELGDHMIVQNASYETSEKAEEGIEPFTFTTNKKE